MLFLPVVVISGAVLYAGSKALRRRKLSERLYHRKPRSVSAAMQKSNQALAVSSASLGLASAGFLWPVPLLGAASIPAMLYVFAPTFNEAWQHLSKEHAINDQVLTAARVSVCVAMGYTVIAALDASLHAYSQRLLVRNKEEFLRILQDACSSGQLALPENLQAVLVQAAENPSLMQQHGEYHGAKFAPWMLASFFLTLPLIGVNRAAAFLTTTFGAHLRKLGPYTQQRISHKAIQQGILITQADSLERAMQVDTFVIDGRLLINPDSQNQALASILALRQRVAQDLTSPEAQTPAFYVLVDDSEESRGRALAQALALDGFFMASPDQDRSQVLAQLQNAGRKVCYLGSGEADSAEIQTAYLAITPFVEHASSHARIILLGNGWQQLAQVFDLATLFTSQQQYNFSTPIGVDIVDISTTLFLDFGLVYSVMFTYTGLFLGLANAHQDKDFNSTPKVIPVTKPTDLVGDIADYDGICILS